MKVSTLLLPLILLFAFGCEDKKVDDIIPVETNPLLGVWERELSPTIQLKCEFTDSLLTLTRTDSEGIMTKKGKYSIEGDGLIIKHNITEVIDHGIIKPQQNGEFYYLTRFFGNDTLRLMDFFYKYDRLSGNLTELNNSSFHGYVVTTVDGETSYTHYKAIFENDSVKVYHFQTSDANLPQTWYPEGPGSRITIETEYYTTYVGDIGLNAAYFLSGTNLYVGAWSPKTKYTRASN